MNSDPISQLRDQAVLLVGTARNCASTVGPDIARLRRALDYFGTIHCLVVESDSDDDTVGELRRLEAEIDHFRFVSLGKLEGEMPLRTERIAHCRNAYLEALNSDPQYGDVDYVVVADLSSGPDHPSRPRFRQWRTERARRHHDHRHRGRQALL